MTVAAAAAPSGALKKPNLFTVILASSAGTAIEWYDFSLFGLNIVLLTSLFFPPDEQIRGLLAALAVHGMGFAMRPLGALFFGRLGDRFGRKRTFLITLVLMGASTMTIGVLPTFASAGALAPLLLITLRLVQGLALGGEYGGAGLYVAEHSPPERRGYYTSFMQATAASGLLLALATMLGLQFVVGPDEYRAWGWRIPFLLSGVLLAVSVYIRLRLSESPVFEGLRDRGEIALSPIRDSFLDPVNRRRMFGAIFGACAGQGVTFHTAQFLVLTMLLTWKKLSFLEATLAVAAAQVLTTPCYILFGYLSDRIGRKKLMVWGAVGGAVTFLPIFLGIDWAAEHGNVHWIALIALLSLGMLWTTVSYAPTAAYLTELFPARIRYTSISVSLNVGAGVFGGMSPLIAGVLVERTGEPLMALAYPIGMCTVSALLGQLLLRETLPARAS
ncbi:MAG: Metabolite transporter [Rhodospirillales bacterium]|nr:Metabolite transporter [Rhodospirillales bacterium]